MLKGMKEDKTTLFLNMLKLKHGNLPDEIREKIVQTDSQSIERWAEKIFTAKTLNEIFD